MESRRTNVNAIYCTQKSKNLILNDMTMTNAMIHIAHGTEVILIEQVVDFISGKKMKME